MAIIAVCGSNSDIETARAHGATDVLMLPFEANIVRQRLRALIRLGMLRGEAGATAPSRPLCLLGIGVDPALVAAHGSDGSACVPMDNAALVHAAQGHFDAFLIGCQPAAQASTLLRQLRAIDRVRTTPAMVVVGAGQQAAIESIFAAGAVDQIAGDASGDEFALRLGAICERKDLLAALQARSQNHQSVNGLDTATGLQGADFCRRPSKARPPAWPHRASRYR
ncbi:MAG: hypothetical protein HC783_18280 [Rhodobacteraceae bacterium]|nr:hypothetical protein [Paracoccaceae bacterium]